MAFSSGTFSLYTPGNPVVTGTTIASSWANNTLDDIATGLTTCLLKDGTQTVTANIPFAGFRLTGIGAATAVADAIQAQQVQNRSVTQLTSVSGTNTIVGTATPTPSAYALGQVFEFIPANTITGAATLNVSSLGAINLYKNSVGGIVACVAGDLVAGNSYLARYDTAGSDQFIVLNPSIPATAAATVSAAGSDQSGATALTQPINIVTTVAASTGVKLSSASSTGYWQIVLNAGANALTVYPDSSSQINALAVDTGFLLATNTACAFWRASTTRWVGVLSA